MMLLNDPRASVRFASVCLAWLLATCCYYSFSEFVHHRHFNFAQMQHGGGHENDHGSGHQGRRIQEMVQQEHQPEEHAQEKHQHGRQGDFDKFHLSHDKLFFWGLAVPIALLAVAGLIWPAGKSSSSAQKKATTKVTAEKAGTLANIRAYFDRKSEGDINVAKWTIIWFIVPLYLIMLEGARGHNVIHPSERQILSHEPLWIRICMSLMSVSGYAATWALALFLIPVTKHSPILDWLRVTPVQALAFHRISGWVGFWNSVLHGFLHLRHLMDVLNRQHERANLEQFKYLLVPEAWGKCLATQNPMGVFWGVQDAYEGTDKEANQCWLALVNGTGMISTIAYALLALTSLPYFRRKFYLLFYAVHIPAAWIMLINAVWHYPTCALILIPNIVYYLSFNVPVYVARFAQWRELTNEREGGALVEVNSIQGGSIELTFAIARADSERHESSYVQVFCPDVSAVSHPFSTFSRDGLVANTGVSDKSGPTKSILLRSKGPFTEGLTKTLFPSVPVPQFVDPLPASRKIQFDSFYAGSFDWIDRAMESHDEILIVAGGVGIVPFLDFLPTLQRRIQAKQGALDEERMGVVDTENRQIVGPNQINLHWYCRETGLASYIWHKYLRIHAHQGWEGNAVCQGRLKIHVHLTKEPAAEEGGEDLLTNVPDLGVAEKIDFGAEDQQQGAVRPVQDVRFMQSLGLRLLVPGVLVSVGSLSHWWWYTQFVVQDQFRRNNLIIRSHPVVYSLLLAMAVSGLMELYHRCYKHGARNQNYDSVSTRQKGDVDRDAEEESSLVESTTSDSTFTYDSVDTAREVVAVSSSPIMGSKMDSDFLKVTGGRPSIKAVIHNIVKAKQPGVYSCGPRTLLDAVEGSIRAERDDCAFYEEDSEM